jgi:hypothetical protein
MKTLDLMLAKFGDVKLHRAAEARELSYLKQAAITASSK